MFFDSHSHGKNGLSSSDGSSILMYFSCLEDLISYLYALYDSMAIDMSLQFDLMPVPVKRDEQMYGHKKIAKAFLKPISRTKICDSKEKHRVMRIVHLLQRKVP